MAALKRTFARAQPERPTRLFGEDLNLDALRRDIRYDDLTAILRAWASEHPDEPAVGATMIWPPNADLTKHDDAIPGSDDVVEYLYRGNGAADYVGGLLDPSVDTPSKG